MPEFTSGGFMQAHWKLLKCNKLSSTDKLIIEYLLCKTNADNGHAWPGMPLIAKTLGTTEQTVKRSVKRLFELQLIKIEKCYRKRSNGYIVDGAAIDRLISGDEMPVESQVKIGAAAPILTEQPTLTENETIGNLIYYISDRKKEHDTDQWNNAKFCFDSFLRREYKVEQNVLDNKTAFAKITRQIGVENMTNAVYNNFRRRQRQEEPSILNMPISKAAYQKDIDDTGDYDKDDTGDIGL